MKIKTPLYILTTSVSLIFAQISLADDIKPPARFYDRQDLPELSKKVRLTKDKKLDNTIKSFDIDRDSMFRDGKDGSAHFPNKNIKKAEIGSFNIKIPDHFSNNNSED